jgi:outer membrane protein assembly factor BamB
MDIRWRYPIHHRVQVIDFSSSYAYFPASHSSIVCLDIRTGDERWRTKIRNVWGWLALSEKAVVYLNQHDELVVMSKDTGELWWTKKLGGIFGWVHAVADSVIVGGWRGYTDIHCFDISTGGHRWAHPAQAKSLHSTFACANHLMFCEGGSHSVTFLDIAAGDVVGRERLEGSWAKTQEDRVSATSEGRLRGLAPSLILKKDASSLYRISGNSASTEVIELDRRIASSLLEEQDGAIGFLDSDQRFCAYEIGTGKLSVYERLHQVRPYAGFWCKGEVSYFAATLQGFVYKFGPGGTERLRVGKRIWSRLGYTAGTLCTGTYSGEVVGIDIGAS